LKRYLNKLLDWPLQAKAMLWICISQMIFSSILLFGVIHRTDHTMRMQAGALQREIDTLLTTALVNPLLQRDFVSLQQIANDLLVKNTVNGLAITGFNGTQYAEIEKNSALLNIQKSEDAQGINWNVDTELKRVLVINYGTQELATVRYSLPLDTQVKERTELVKQFILIALGIAALAIVSGGYLSGRIVTRVRAMKRISDRAILGDYSSRIVIRSKDELGGLAMGLNQLADSVNERMKALTQSEVLKTSYLYAAQTEQARLTALLDSMRFGIVFFNNQQELIYSNEAVKKIWPAGLPEFVGQATNHGRERMLDDGRIIFETSHTVLSNVLEVEFSSAAQADDSAIAPNAPNAPNAIGSLWVFEDVTTERQAEMTIRFLAERDPLTGLYNRRSFTTALQQAIEKQPDVPMALVYVDLDDFKLINDLKGHQQGDKVLIDIASKLASVTRSSDVVARIGGDEFVVLVTGITPEDQANWCDRLLLQLSSNTLSGEHSTVSCSVGMAWYPRDGGNPESLLAAADQAMYDAKRAGKNAWRNFQEQTSRTAEKVKTVLWAERISNALRTDGFDIFLQGVHHADTRAIHHFEALIRMPDPQNPGTRFNPGEFIGYAEESGKITQLDRWMIKHCIALLAEHPALPPIAVNISAVSLSDSSFPCFVAEQLLAFNVSGKRLHLELTETAALSDINIAQAAVAALQRLDCEICLDDFGSGFTSLSYLKLIQANYLKIDGMFIRGINDDRENQVLLRAIVDIAASSGRLTVAEWIEDEAMLETVRGYKVDLVQGYHLSKPAPAKEAIDRLLVTQA
jgi:diguanylate cyclase (GGDEF)-like protein